MDNKKIKEVQKACLDLIRALEVSKKETNKDVIYENLKEHLHSVNTTIDKVFEEIIFE